MLTARELGVEPGRCYVVEDSPNGIRAAHAANMHPIMVPDLQTPGAEMRSLAEVIVPSLKEAKEYLADILEKAK